MVRAHNSFKHFAFIFWFHPHNNPIRCVIIIIPFYRRENRGTEKVRNLPKMTGKVTD